MQDPAEPKNPLLQTHAAMDDDPAGLVLPAGHEAHTVPLAYLPAVHCAQLPVRGSPAYPAMHWWQLAPCVLPPHPVHTPVEAPQVLECPLQAQGLQEVVASPVEKRPAEQLPHAPSSLPHVARFSVEQAARQQRLP